MRFWEAMKALEEGKKIRFRVWPPDEFFSLKVDKYKRMVCDENGQFPDVNFFYCFDEDWEFYSDVPKNYKLWELIPALKEGKKIKRKGVEMNSLSINFDGMFEDDISDSYWLKIEDLEADDWVICE